MKCPSCGEFDSKVVDSRTVKDGSEIRRRRECDGCSRRFTTYERTEVRHPMVIKKDGRREPWTRNKILRGLNRAFEKRPVSVTVVDDLVDAIEREFAVGGVEVPCRAIGEHIMNKLREIDQVAYVRFASVYRSFKDIGEFVSEIAALETRRDSDAPPTGE